jgi:hypothetical protein
MAKGYSAYQHLNRGRQKVRLLHESRRIPQFECPKFSEILTRGCHDGNNGKDGD